MERTAAQAAQLALWSQGRRHPAGVVISAGKMQRTVKVRLMKQVWNKHLGKYYKRPYTIFAHDANSSVLEGDVVSVEPERHAKHVLHAVSAIISPFGIPLNERPPLLTLQERQDKYLAKRAAKLERRMERMRLAETVQQGLVDPPAQDENASEDVKVLGLKSDGQTPRVLEHGREVLQGGLHKYGKINKEAWANKQKAIELEEKGVQNEAEKEKAQAKDQDEVAMKRLHEEPGR